METKEIFIAAKSPCKLIYIMHFAGMFSDRSIDKENKTTVTASVGSFPKEHVKAVVDRFARAIHGFGAVVTEDNGVYACSKSADNVATIPDSKISYEDGTIFIQMTFNGLIEAKDIDIR